MAEKPDYRVYKSRWGFLNRLLYRDHDRFDRPGQKPAPGTVAGAGVGTAPRPATAPGVPPERPGLPPRPEHRPAPWRRVPWRRVAKWAVIAVAGWILLSFLLFMISAQIQAGKMPDRVKNALDDGGNMLTSANNILVLGSDRRPGEPGPSRADTIMLLRYGGGKAARLSIPRDTQVDIPGHGSSKVNAAFAYGGTPLMIKTLKQWLGIEINHVVVVDFKNFPKFVDSLGGVSMDLKGCIVSHFEGRTPRYGCKGNFKHCKAKSGKTHLSGEEALDVVRIRKNSCAPFESDLTRARRQQQFLDAVKHRTFSPFAFPRWPWAAWRAPRAVRSDMGGLSLLALFFDSEVSGAAKPTVLRPINPGANPLQVSPAEKEAAVQRFLKG
jgi:LCP family protein required for cell wall assembly